MVVLLPLALVSCTSENAGTEGTSKTELTTFTEKSSYALGMTVAAPLEQVKGEIDLPTLIQGMKDRLENREPLLAEDEASKVMEEFQQKMREKTNQDRAASGANNLMEGQAFLAENKAKEGVVTTDSGLQYIVLTEADGPAPSSTDKVSVNYRGTLIDGTEFDSSYKRNQPATFGVNQVIPGWTEALQLMKVGSKYRLFIPSELAYRERGQGPLIGPNSVLIFEVELLEIVK
ncbi:MAG: FKBP-type peptidyl-prolyl cis-trans isomerase [Candidatus Eisenbacteria sp.]|nr:FKBP-type peptidyl-prolyl cis-trans isomerase [Candidatus Eisenbacteria bacterium]